MDNDISPKQELEQEIFEANLSVEREEKERRNYLAFGFIFSMPLVTHYAGAYVLNIWLLVICWVLSVLGYLAAFGSDVAKERSKYEKLVFRKNLLFSSTSNTNSSDSHFDSLVNINLENLAEYYRLVKSHTQKSFNASLLVALFGFALIALGLSISFMSEKYEKLSYISTASGVIIEFISASFFYLYSKTVRQLKGYHDSLIDVQNMLLSFRLIDSTQEQEHKVKLVEKMMDFLSSKK